MKVITRLAVLWAALLGVSAAGCGSTNGPRVLGGTPPPAQIVVTLSGALAKIGDSATVQASQAGYTGAFIFTTSEQSILALSLPPGQTSSARTPAGARTTMGLTGAASLTAQHGAVVITVVGNGSATVTAQNTTQSAVVQVVTVTTGASPSPSPSPSPIPPGSVTLTPASLSLVGIGAAYAQSFTVSETHFTSTFTESDTCSSVATLSGSGGSPLTVTVTPTNTGTCTATFTDTFNRQATESITVTAASITVQREAQH
ncbi:MAG: hypothetical protein ACXVAG_08700 [Vulcanimicrobiaceae bacterium]